MIHLDLISILQSDDRLTKLKFDSVELYLFDFRFKSCDAFREIGLILI